MVERGYRIRGRVQGVGFRWWTRSQALRLGISGSVRNCPDGTVEVHARGSQEAVEALRRRLDEGPPGARVEEVEEISATMSPPASGFTIER
ncbi:MAG TPA: acylphosphatase [Longimicrobiaceae bacterium]|nr:acylphosphatase [Longimicrobiaceae bacterium]